MTEKANTSEIMVNFYQTAQHNHPEKSHLHTHCCENLKFQNTFPSPLSYYLCKHKQIMWSSQIYVTLHQHYRVKTLSTIKILSRNISVTNSQLGCMAKFIHMQLKSSLWDFYWCQECTQLKLR
jgi:hypothetical protein